MLLQLLLLLGYRSTAIVTVVLPALPHILSGRAASCISLSTSEFETKEVVDYSEKGR
jgi:hypothetical protein